MEILFIFTEEANLFFIICFNQTFNLSIVRPARFRKKHYILYSKILTEKKY